jgi:hypothetical protein
VIRNGSRQPETVPLCFPMLPKPVMPSINRPYDPTRTDWPDVMGTGFPGPTSLLVPYDSQRALHEIRYSDIQKWLAAHPPPSSPPKGQ